MKRIAPLARALAFLSLACLLPACASMPKNGSRTQPDPGAEWIDQNDGQDIIMVTDAGPAYSDLRQHSYGEVGSDFDPDVSNDSKWLAFASTANALQPDIYIKSTNGSALRRLTTDPGADIQPALSPDGSMIAWASNRNGNWDIFVTSTAGGQGMRQVTRSYDDDISPSWSPDGTKLCYSSKANGVWKIWIYDLKAQSETVLGPGLYPKWNPATDPRHPQYNTIVFQRARQRDAFWYEIWTLRADGTAPTQLLSSNKWGCIHPSWRKDGNKIVFCTVYKSVQATIEGRIGQGDDIFVIDPDGSNLTHITSHLRADWNPIWGADGRIYFSSDRNGYKNIWSVRPWVMELDMPGEQAAMPDSTRRMGSEDFSFEGIEESHDNPLGHNDSN